jgi:DNA-binding XRE family transcriptional regulator
MTNTTTPPPAPLDPEQTRKQEMLGDIALAWAIAALRKRNGLSHEELATQTGVPEQELMFHELGSLPISLPRLMSLLPALTAVFDDS